MNMIKKFALAAVLGLGGLVSAFAEGAAGNYDFSTVTTELTSVKEAIITWMGNAFPVVMAVAGCFLIVWLAKIALRMLKGLGAAGK